MRVDGLGTKRRRGLNVWGAGVGKIKDLKKFRRCLGSKKNIRSCPDLGVIRRIKEKDGHFSQVPLCVRWKFGGGIDGGGIWGVKVKGG